MVPILDSLKNFFSRSVRGIPPTPEGCAAEETATRTQGMENLTSVGSPAPSESARVNAGADVAAMGGLPADAFADLVLRAVGAQPVAVVKALYTHCGCDLKGAKDLADRAPVIVMEGASREAIASAYIALHGAGAEVEVIIR